MEGTTDARVVAKCTTVKSLLNDNVRKVHQPFCLLVLRECVIGVRERRCSARAQKHVCPWSTRSSMTLMINTTKHCRHAPTTAVAHHRVIMQQPSPSGETAHLLARLSNRPGVQGTLILSRDTGAIVRSSGFATDEDEAETENIQLAVNGAVNGEVKERGTRKEDEVARLVWKFHQSVGEMVEELNGNNDEAKLLRIRTKKNELVIVPGT